MQPDAYPVRVRGDLDPALSRWQWLVKWFLAIPHYIVLFFLHVAAVVVTVIAFFAILFTGRYPRTLFDFNVGVMRWRWRVAFYALSALGTDRYPPFSLQTKAEYPADLEVDYPERLSRGLVLIKWWLLAPGGLPLQRLASLPDRPPRPRRHNVAFATGDPAARRRGGAPVHRPVPHRAIQPVNRWALRVRAYTTLMRDEYPPLRLDMGPREQVSQPATAASDYSAGGAESP